MATFTYFHPSFCSPSLFHNKSAPDLLTFFNSKTPACRPDIRYQNETQEPRFEVRRILLSSMADCLFTAPEDPEVEKKRKLPLLWSNGSIGEFFQLGLSSRCSFQLAALRNRALNQSLEGVSKSVKPGWNDRKILKNNAFYFSASILIINIIM